MHYRREIDGLRAIAVLPVILFHGGSSLLPGGFVGVDVFFVISGFLITSIIASECRSGTFSIIAFYERRARRILPALIFVILSCIPFAIAWMLPYQLIDFSKSVIAVNMFVSNILFWRESGYFSAAAELKPLLHTWSLAVEEQYYILFPVFVLIFWRFGVTALKMIIAIAALCSLGLAEWAAQHSYVSANFYLLPTRAWELLIGSLLALFAMDREYIRQNTTVSQIGAGLGLILIVSAMISYSRSTPFPGLYALMPTIGTALVIRFATPDTIAGRLLSLPPLVGIGLISYSAYLWHQPLFAFARIASEDAPPDALIFALSIISLLLAWGSWRFVERPFRNKQLYSRKRIFTVAGTATVALTSLAFAAIAGNGFVTRFPKADHHLVMVNPGNLGRYVEGRFRRLTSRKFDKKHKRQRVLIIGDSFAQDFANMAGENGYMADLDVVAFAIAARCPVYIGSADISQIYKTAGLAYDHTYCDTHSNIRHARALALAADTIIIVASWEKWEAEKITETIHSLVGDNVKQILVFGDKSFGAIKPLTYLKVMPSERGRLRNKISTNVIDVNSVLKRVLPPDQFVDVSALICQNNHTCPVFTPDMKLISFDGGHLTAAGARYAGSLVFAHPALANLK